MEGSKQEEKQKKINAIRERIGSEAKNGAGAASQGKCLRYVGNAVQRALGKAETATGINSAKDSAPFFKKLGLKLAYDNDF